MVDADDTYAGLDDTYWGQDARNDRDEYDQQVRAWDEDDRDRLTRDEGERAA